jgi:transposase
MSKNHGSLSPQEIKRLQGGEMILDGYDNEEIAEILGVSTRTVQRWRNRLEDNDNLYALSRKEGSGHPSLLTEEQKQQLISAVPSTLAIPSNGGHRTSSPI